MLHLWLLRRTRMAILEGILRLFMGNFWDIAPKFALKTIKMSICYKMDPFIEILTDFCDCDGTSTCKE
ncbi:hypothetical protein BK671_07995 [Pseudomonas fluorescens]|uniref:Uncharacterized protein n=1 Tax=Pseudomonas fluorescens TaxID=294 RepID=A0A423LMA0_PSEFL|nr:hypothetical protein BK671_07995 [Pseudomonas fluorescens]